MFLRNAWYVATWSKDLAAQPMARTFLGEQVVLFRGADGKPAAITDRCPHRAAPLSRGVCVDGLLQCGYHGLRFDPAGHCVRVPGQSHIPAGASVRSYPVHEQWNIIWIWMGDPARADVAGIPNLYWLDSPDWEAVPGYLHANANYELIVDNLLDLTHVSYLHSTTLAGDPREATVPIKFERIPDGVRISRWMLGFTPPPLFARAGNFDGPVDRWQVVTWHPASVVYLDVGCARAGTGAPEGDRSQGISFWSTHLVTPETAESTHYHYGFTRNFALGDPAMSTLLMEGSRAAFSEDVAMVEAQQKNVRAGELKGLIDINADAPPLRARRALQKLMDEESARTTR
ncbi:MAG: Rieske 2Fe-2S domain-containing protein [Burkholderiales bacterium]